MAASVQADFGVGIQVQLQFVERVAHSRQIVGHGVVFSRHHIERHAWQENLE